MNAQVVYVVRFRAQRALSSDGSLITAEGARCWVVKEPSGWVQATSRGIHIFGDDKPFDDVKTWDTAEEAQKFMEKWEGHPWYARPRSWEVVPVRAVPKEVFSHYEVVNKT